MVASTLYVAAPFSDADEEDVVRRPQMYPTGEMPKPNVYVVEDDDVQILNVSRQEQVLRHQPPAVSDATWKLRGALPFPPEALSSVGSGFNFGTQFATSPVVPHHHRRVEIPAWQQRDEQAWQHSRGDHPYFDTRNGMPSVSSRELYDEFPASRPLPNGILGVRPGWSIPALGGQPLPQERMHGMPAGGGPASHMANAGILKGEPTAPASSSKGMLMGHDPPYTTRRRVMQERHSNAYDAAVPPSREHGILGGGPASQLRGRRDVWNQPPEVTVMDDAARSRLGENRVILGRPVKRSRESESTAREFELQFREPRHMLPMEESASAPVQGLPRPHRLNNLVIHGNTVGEWWNHLQASVGAEFSPLHWDILRFCKAHELTPGQLQVRRNALEYVEHAVHEIWPRAKVLLFGSTATDLALPWSDIDIVVLSSRDEQGFTPSSWQSALGNRLRQLGQCRSVKHVRHAKVPILKVTFKSGLACDISFDAVNGPNGVPLIRQFMQQHEALRPLCLVLKVFLGKQNLNEVYSGGLGSFCLINMIVGHLQKLGVHGGGHDLGTLLVSFFIRYAVMHDYRTDVVSTVAHVCDSKQEKGWVSASDPELLAVEDPLDPTSDIAKGSYRIRTVRRKFLQAQKLLLSEWHRDNILAHVLDTMGNTVEFSPQPSWKKRKRGDTASIDQNNDHSVQVRRKKRRLLVQGSGSFKKGRRKQEQKVRKTRSKSKNKQRATP